VRMVVYEGGRRCPAMIFNEKIMCGLGAELSATGRLSPRGRERALRALIRFVTLAPGLRIGALAGVATAAVREAADGAEFCAEVARRTGIRLEIAGGEDEARLSAQGVLFGDPGAHGLVVDLGGASLEFCPIGSGKTGRGVTTPLGPQRLGDLSKGIDRARAIIDREMAPLAGYFGRATGRLHLVGGAWRTLGRVQIHRSGHPLQVLHEHCFSPEDAHLAARWVLSASPAELDAVPGVSSDRVPTLPHAALLLQGLLDHFAPEGLVLSGFGLREGVCYEYLPAHIRNQDPLISTCAGHERTRARAPGFGVELASWLFGAVPPRDAGEERLIRAICHLADVSWRAHPDYRPSACIEIVTRTNLSGIGHPGRAFIAATLLARYRGSKGMGDAPILSLLPAEAAERAGRLGALMRLGCTIAGVTPGFLPWCPVTLHDETLRLSPAPEAARLMGEEVEKRLAQAARAFGVKPEVSPA
jgi:exopolyphosphatase / guanosine-5'-triphosphate,3'-diphosphate pyrophosphatase